MNIPNIPDNFHKFLVLIGGLIIVFCYYTDNVNVKSYNNKVELYNDSSDSITILLLKENLQLLEIESKAKLLAEKEGSESQFLMNNDSIFIFTRIVKKNGIPTKITDSLETLIKIYDKNKSEARINNERLKLIGKKLTRISKNLNNERKSIKVLIIVGGIFLTIGFYSWNNQQKIKDGLLKWELITKGEIYSHCQSCGKNFSAIRLYGKNIDGDANYAFCSECYINGHFKYEKNDEYFVEIKNKALSSTKNKLKRNSIKRRFDNLIRWKKNDF